MRKFSSLVFSVSFIYSTSLLFSSVALASAFQLFEYSGRDAGNYGAGGAAIAEDASTTFTNPAGLTRLPQEIVAAGTIVNIFGDFKGKACGGIGNNCVLSHSHENGGGTVAIPAFHYAYPLDQEVSLGIGITAPFGLGSHYKHINDPVGYSGTASGIGTMNINPGVGVNLNEQWSLGFGADAMNLEAIFNSRMNLDPQALPNSFSRNHLKHWGYGWNAGLLYKPECTTRVGLSFRSQVAMHLRGTSKIVGGALAPDHSHVKANMTLPETWMLSGFQEITDRFDMMATVLYTKWDKFKQLRFQNATVPSSEVLFGTTTGVVTIPQNFDNTWRFSVGGDYQWTDVVRLRAGVGYDKTPLNNKDRTVRLPDESRVAMAVGLKYAPITYMDFDLGYTHLFFPHHAKINNVTTLSHSVGKSENHIDLVGLQMTWYLDSNSTIR